MINTQDEGCKDPTCIDAWRWHKHIDSVPGWVGAIWVEDTGLEDWEK